MLDAIQNNIIGNQNNFDYYTEKMDYFTVAILSSTHFTAITAANHDRKVIFFTIINFIFSFITFCYDFITFISYPLC